LISSLIHHRYTTYIWTGQRCRRRSLSRWVDYRATISRSTGRIAGRRQRASNTSGVEHRPAAREATNSRHHGLHLLWYICREASAVRSCFLRAPSVSVRPRSITPWY
jgi:hypothetical protein